MCRLAAFPPNFPREKALKILQHFEKCNTDGVGSVHIKDGAFVVDKHPIALSKLLETENNQFLAHMPHNGWTLAHLRAASHGENTMENTHPFIVGNWAIVHNGVWSEYSIAKLIFEKTITFKGETDTEVAAQLINLIGPRKFGLEIDMGGVFLSLHINGDLHVSKTSGELYTYKSGEAYLLASEFDQRSYKNIWEVENGWVKFSKYAKYIANRVAPKKWVSSIHIKDDDEDDNVPFTKYVPRSYYTGYVPGYTSTSKAVTPYKSYVAPYDPSVAAASVPRQFHEYGELADYGEYGRYD